VRESLKAILEASIVEMLFFLAAWYLQLIKSSNYGWISKTFMIILGIAGVIIHKRPREYGLITKNLKFDLKWSAYTLIIFILTSISTITVSFFLNHLKPIKLNVIITDFYGFSYLLVLRRSYFSVDIFNLDLMRCLIEDLGVFYGLDLSGWRGR